MGNHNGRANVDNVDAVESSNKYLSELERHELTETCINLVVPSIAAAPTTRQATSHSFCLNVALDCQMQVPRPIVHQDLP